MTKQSIWTSTIGAAVLAAMVMLVTACSSAAVGDDGPSYAAAGSIGNQNTSTFLAVAGGY